jgi:hypothetical protein
MGKNFCIDFVSPEKFYRKDSLNFLHRGHQKKFTESFLCKIFARATFSWKKKFQNFFRIFLKVSLGVQISYFLQIFAATFFARANFLCKKYGKKFLHRFCVTKKLHRKNSLNFLYRGHQKKFSEFFLCKICARAFFFLEKKISKFFSKIFESVLRGTNLLLFADFCSDFFCTWEFSV